MAHEVTLDISTKFVLHKDVKIDVKKDGRKLGTALVSKGNIEWVPAGTSRLNSGVRPRTPHSRHLYYQRFAFLEPSCSSTKFEQHFMCTKSSTVA